MTNKNKRSTTAQAKKQKKADDAAAAKMAPASSGSYESPYGPMKAFTKAQLGAMLCVAIGVAKLMELSAAIGQAGTDSPKRCMSYLIDEEACLHPSFGSLVQVKYFSGISLTALVLSLILNLWSDERLFLKFMTCLCVSPLTTTAMAAAVCDKFLKKSPLYYLIVMCGVLLATSLPSSNATEHFPFVNEKSWTAKSLQSWCLISLAILSVIDIARAFGAGDAGMQNALLAIDGEPLPAAAQSLVYFWIVDKISMASLYAFSVVHLPKNTQRAVLWVIALVKLGEYFYQLPRMMDPFQDSQMIETVTIGSAVFAGVAWFW